MFNKTIALVCKDIILQWKTKKKLMTKFTFPSTSVFSFLTMNWNWLSTVTIKLSFYIKIIHNTRFNMNWNMPSFLGTFSCNIYKFLVNICALFIFYASFFPLLQITRIETYFLFVTLDTNIYRK